MLTRVQVKERMRAFTPEGIEAADAAVMPGWQLVPDDGGPIRLGGAAPLRVDEEWPREERGVPLTFVAAIPVEALVGMPGEWRSRQPLPELRGIIRVFADLASSPYETTSARIDLVSEGTSLQERDAPPLPYPWPVADDHDPGSESAFQDELEPEERIVVLRRAHASVRPILTVDAVAYRESSPSDADSVAFEAFADAVRSPLAWGTAKMLGLPDEIQDDPRYDGGSFFPELDAVDEWVPLLELHSTFGNVGLIDNGGAYVILVAAEDLRAGRFDRVICHVAQG